MYSTIYITLRKFTEFLDKNGICDIKNVDVGLVHDFCRNPGNCKPNTWVLRMSHLRCFLRFVFSRKGTERDLSLAVAAVKHFRHAGLPDVLTGAEVDKILGCVDRSNGRRKRDFVILLLAACYGMRPSDILRLRLDDIHWRERSIVYCQSKTGKPITLPLLPEISEALIDYLRSWRPPTKSRCIFVRHQVPFEPFASKDRLYWIMPEALRRAGIYQTPRTREVSISSATHLPRGCLGRTSQSRQLATSSDTPRHSLRSSIRRWTYRLCDRLLFPSRRCCNERRGLNVSAGLPGPAIPSV